MDKKKAFICLKKAAQILDAHDIHYWLEAGTCLGAIRNKGFIDHDEDIDLGIFAEDCNTLDDILALYGSFLSNGFSIYHTFGKLDKGFEVAFMLDGVKIDIFWFYKKDDKRWHGAWKNGGRNGDSDLIKLVFDADLFTKNDYAGNIKTENKLDRIDFLGLNLPVPSNTDKYLLARYGKDWMIKDKRWCWATSPKCIDNNFEI